VRLIDPAEFFHVNSNALEETLLPPVNSVDLARQTHRDYQCRFGEKNPNIAELFHDNSKYIRNDTRRPSEKPAEIAAIIDRMQQQSYNPAPDSIGDMAASPVSPRQQWNTTVPSCLENLGLYRVEKFYCFDTLVLVGGTLSRILPGKGIVWQEALYDAEKIDHLPDCFFGPSAEQLSEFDALVFFVGSPWRYMMLYGPKGYRIMMRDLGHILGLHQPHLDSGEWTLLEHYYDNELDRFLIMDGLEHSIQLVVGCRQKPVGEVKESNDG